MQPINSRLKNSLKLVHSDILQSQFIPFTHLNSPTIVESKNGMIGMVIKFAGVAFDTADDSQLNAWKRKLHNAFAMLDERFCLLQTTHRKLENKTLTGNFSNGFARELDTAYHKQFNSKNLYVNDLYLTVIYKGITAGKIGKGLSLFRHLSDKVVQGARAHSRQKQQEELINAVKQLLILLDEFSPHVIGSIDEELDHSELCAFLSLWMNGGRKIQVNKQAQFPTISNTFKESHKNKLFYPQGHLAQYLSACRLFFGSSIQFNHASTGEVQFGKMLSVKQYPSVTASIMLNGLLQLDAEFIATQSFSVEPKNQSLYRIKAHTIKLLNAGDEAHSQIEALTLAQDDVASSKTLMGHHHNTIMVLAASLEAVEIAANSIIKCYSESNFVAMKETLGMLPAFWSQLPMNHNYIVRSSLITLENFVDFMPLHNYHIGFRDANHLGSSVTLLETPAKTPVFFNYHVKGSKNDPAKGHALIIGGNGSGKTALMTFMDAQMQRYGGTTFYFDRDQGAKIYVLASGGHYSVLSPNFPETTCFNPFQLTDTPENRSFCLKLLIKLCQSSETDTLAADEVEMLARCIEYNFEKLDLTCRQLTFIVKVLPINFSYWPTLRRWLRGHGKFSDGDYAYLFDNPVDTLDCYLLQHPLLGFDMTHFLDNEPLHVRTPLMMYLLHRIKTQLTGQRVSILLDEGWQYFIDAFWVKELEKLLPTLRKYNGHLVIATQSPASVLKSSIASMMLDNAPTKLFFSNPQAKASEYIAGFNLSETEYQFIVNTPPEKRLFLYKQDKFTCICKLNLSSLPHLLSILSGNKKSILVVDELIKQHGSDTNVWLPHFYRYQEEISK